MVLFTTMTNWEYFKQYPAIAIVIYVLVPLIGLGYFAVLLTAIVQSRKMFNEKMTWEECKAYSDKIRAQYPDEPEQVEQVTEKPYITHYIDQEAKTDSLAWGVEKV